MTDPRNAIAVAAVLALALAGCGPDKSREDANDTTQVDKRAPEVIAFNNHYPNVETKCNHGHRIYVATSGAYKVWIVENDPSCPGAAGR